MNEFSIFALQLIVDKINQENNSKLTVNQLLFDLPEPTNEFGLTKIKVTGKPFSGVVGTVELFYNRIDLGDILVPTPDIFTLKQQYYDEPASNDYIKISDIIGLVNDYYKLNLTNKDFFDANLTKPSILAHQKNAEVTIAAKPDSLLYVGTGKILISYMPGFYDINLVNVVTNIRLNGFTLSNLITV